MQAGARPSPLSARAFFRDPIEYVRSLGSNGKVTRLAAGRSSFLLVRDPEEIWRVLVTDAGGFRQGKWKRRQRRFVGETLNTLDGDDHRRRRALLQPSLDRRRIATFAPAIVARAERAQEQWQDGARIVLRDELDRLSLTIAGDALLSTDLEPGSAELADALAQVMIRVPRFTPPVPGTRHAKALAQVNGAVLRIVDERRRSPGDGDDLVGALLRSGLPADTVRGEVIAFLLAAVDEPPSGLAAAWYLLAQEPAAEERFHAELDSVLGDQPVGLDDDARLPYLDAVLREALRLYPPARYVDRCPISDTEIGGARIRAGSNVLLSPLVTQQEASLHDRPSDFVPERWLDPAPPAPARSAYFPFGAGAHTCIGEPLARSIMTLTLATIGRRWRLRIASDAPPPIPSAPRLVTTLDRR